jgi:3-oxoacyl-[acyl-carrier-protein] synthase I
MAPVYIQASAQFSAQDIDNFTINSPTKNQGTATFLNKPDDIQNCLYRSINTKLITGIDHSKHERILSLLYLLVEELITNNNISSSELAECHLFLGSTSLDIGAIKSINNKQIWLNPLDYLNQKIIDQFNLPSLNFIFNTACTSSANALIYASRLIRTGKIKKALVIGAEFYNPLTLKGFSSLELLTQNELLAFHKQRDGMILGEGLGALIVSADSTPNKCLELLEGYSSCDTYSLTGTQEDGTHISKVIERALALSNVSAKQIDLIKVHGTASPASDSAEANALTHVFAEKVPPIFALKPFIGHTLGACGVLETALLNGLLGQNLIPVPAFAQTSNETLHPYVSALENINNRNKPQFILANHCGFGGNNAAFIMKTNGNNAAQTPSPATQPSPLKVSSLELISQKQQAYPRSMTLKELRKKLKLKTGFDLRRMDSFTLIALDTVFDLIDQQNSHKNIGLYGVANYFSVELLQSLILTVEQNQDIRPFDFISTVGNAANFHVAQKFNLTGPNLFLGAYQNGTEHAKLLAQTDLNLNLIDAALVINWHESTETINCTAELYT